MAEAAEAAAALASLGVAANVLQFFNLAGKVAAQGWRIRRGPDRQIEDAFDLNTLANLTSRLRSNLNELELNAQECKAGMGQVATDCAQVADQLLGQLERLDKIWGSGRKPDEIKTAAMSLWKQGETKALGQKLEHIKSEFAIQLLLSLRSYIVLSNIPKRQEDAFVLRQPPSGTAGVFTALQALHEIIKDPRTTTPGLLIWEQISTKIPPSESDELLKSLRPFIFDAIATRACDVVSVYRLSNTHSSGSSDISNKSVSAKLQDRVLDRLDSDVMNYRQAYIPKAHAMTFEWIFMPPSANNSPLSSFPDWLQDTTASLYWMTGKPGSGKSTLMKFILTFNGSTQSQYGTVVEAMLPRAEGEPSWTLVSFFAWYAGQKLQKSIDGLCRSLISQLVKSHPDVLLTVFPSCWEALWLLNDMGPQQMTTVKGEREVLLNMVREVTKTGKIFFLIDGLDEIDSDTEKAAELVLDLASVRNVKVCTSSRPWPVFEDAFGREPNLTMQDLTKSDMRAFVEHSLDQNYGFSRLQEQHPKFASGLIDQVVQKSAGVFLWVRLVVQLLSTSLMVDNHIVDLQDRFHELQKRIDELPSGLDLLFTRIIEGLNDGQLNHAKRYFGLLSIHRFQYPDENLTALALSFADENCPQFAASMAIGPLSERDVGERVYIMAGRVRSASMGLLEVVGGNSSRESRVNYLHRTVTDFLKSGTALNAVLMTTESYRDASLSIQLSSAHLCLLKCLQQDAQLLRAAECRTFTKLVYKILSFAGRADRELSKGRDIVEAQIVQLLDHLDNTGKSLAKLVDCSEVPAFPSASSFETFDIDYYKTLSAMQQHHLKTLQSGHWAWCLGAIHADDIVTPSLEKIHNGVRSIISIDHVITPKTSGRTFLSMVVRTGIRSYIKARAAPGCLVQRMELRGSVSDIQTSFTDWPLLTDALDNIHVDSNMIRQLLQLNADPGFLFYFSSSNEQTTPLRLAIHRATMLDWDKQLHDNWSGDFEETRQLLMEMFSVSGCKNMSENAEAHLKEILEDRQQRRQRRQRQQQQRQQHDHKGHGVRPLPGYDRDESRNTEYGGLRSIGWS